MFICETDTNHTRANDNAAAQNAADKFKIIEIKTNLYLGSGRGYTFRASRYYTQFLRFFNIIVSHKNVPNTYFENYLNNIYI